MRVLSLAVFALGSLIACTSPASESAEKETFRKIPEDPPVSAQPVTPDVDTVQLDHGLDVEVDKAELVKKIKEKLREEESLDILYETDNIPSGQ